MKLLTALEWRYATKKFDPQRKISKTDLDSIKRAVQLSPSSYGLQLYKVLIIDDKSIREELFNSSRGQSQILDASHIAVFCNDVAFSPDRVDSLIELKSKIRNKSSEEKSKYSQAIQRSLSLKSDDIYANWTAKQAYIAMTGMLYACAELSIDTCPMEGFDSKAYNEILNLNELGLNAAVVVAMGYRSKEDGAQFEEKVRRPLESIFINI